MTNTNKHRKELLEQGYKEVSYGVFKLGNGGYVVAGQGTYNPYNK